MRASDAASSAAVLVVAAPPEAVLVATEWRAVKPLVHAPKAVQPTLVRRVGVVDDAILEHERAHAGPLSPERLPVRSDHARREVVEPGTVLAVSPEPGTRAQVGSTVTLTVARAPHWVPVGRSEGTEDAEPSPISVPAGARLVLATVDTSPLGLFGGDVDVRLSGDVEGESRVDAGETLVLADVAGQARTIEVALDVHGSVHWALSVEEPR